MASDANDPTECDAAEAINVLMFAAVLMLLYALVIYPRSNRTEKGILQCCVAGAALLIASGVVQGATAEKMATASHVILGVVLVLIPAFAWHTQILVYNVVLVLIVTTLRKYYGRCIFDDIDKQSAKGLLPTNMNVDIVLALLAGISLAKIAITCKS